jgi:hypothetical protein
VQRDVSDGLRGIGKLLLLVHFGCKRDGRLMYQFLRSDVLYERGGVLRPSEH